jgi:4-hydroxyacetophenone monooxygenase
VTDPAGGDWDDAAIAEAARYADAPLLAALAQTTGDFSVLRDNLRPDLSIPIDPMAGWTEAMLAEAGALAERTLKAWRDRGWPEPSQASLEELRRIMDFTAGGAVDAQYLPLLYEELGGEGDDPRAPAWRAGDIAPGRRFRVAVVGAGMSGLVAAHRLAQAGMDFVVLEKNDDVGGTWFENSYPGCRVDVPNHFYSYSFAQKEDWPFYFSPRGVLLDYFRTCTDSFGLRHRIRFRSEVTAATWSEDSCTWSLDVQGPGGVERLEVEAVVFALGQLNRPHTPEIAGVGDFAGPAFHSARWRHDVDLTGKRVAVIGTGASGAQLIPVLAEEAAELTVFQRTPNWLLPAPDYQAPIPDGKLWLFRHVPFYNQWYRFWIFYRSADALLPATEVDPQWPDPGSVGLGNALARAYMQGYLEEQFADRPDLIPDVVPSYPPFAKRMVFDNGSWAQALKRPNVRLVTDAITRVTANGVETEAARYDVDVLVFATGFLASRFLEPVQVTGRDGTDLHAMWNGDARAYLGITVPKFPNLFVLYGPNTNIVVNGSIIYFSECEVRYVLGCLRLLVEGGHDALEVRPDVHDEYNRSVDEANARRVWGAAHVNTWYKNALGRVSQNWPFTLQEYWRRTREPDPGDYTFSSAKVLS